MAVSRFGGSIPDSGTLFHIVGEMNTKKLADSWLIIGCYLADNWLLFDNSQLPHKYLKNIVNSESKIQLNSQENSFPQLTARNSQQSCGQLEGDET